MIELSHVYKTYAGNVHALRNVDLEISQGEFVFLTGPSGAGKSTLFRLLSAMDSISSGHIKVAGFDLKKISEKEICQFRRKLGIVFQDFKLLPNKTIYENIALPLEIRGESNSMIKRKVEEVIDLVGLQQKEDQYPEFISGGEQQRTAIARAIVHQPGLIIADEPTGNLDPERGEEIIDLFERACLQGSTVFIATHDLELVKRRQKRVVEIKDGMISKELR